MCLAVRLIFHPICRSRLSWPSGRPPSARSPDVCFLFSSPFSLSKISSEDVSQQLRRWRLAPPWRTCWASWISFVKPWTGPRIPPTVLFCRRWKRRRGCYSLPLRAKVVLFSSLPIPLVFSCAFCPHYHRKGPARGLQCLGEGLVGAPRQGGCPDSWADWREGFFCLSSLFPFLSFFSLTHSFACGRRNPRRQAAAARGWRLSSKSKSCGA